MSTNSFSETSENGFLKHGIRHSFIDSKELSLLDNIEFSPVPGIVSEVYQEENPYFTDKNDWNVRDLDQRDVEPITSNPSETTESPERSLSDVHRTLKYESSCGFEDILWGDFDFFQDGPQLLVGTSNSNEDELVSFFSFLKTDGKDQDVSKETSVPSCPDRTQLTSNYGTVKERFQTQRRRSRRLLEKSSEVVFDELEFDNDIFNIKGALFIKDTVQKSSHRGVSHYKKRSRRFPVDRSSLLRSVLTKNVTFSVL